MRETSEPFITNKSCRTHPSYRIFGTEMIRSKIPHVRWTLCESGSVLLWFRLTLTTSSAFCFWNIISLITDICPSHHHDRPRYSISWSAENGIVCVTLLFGKWSFSCWTRFWGRGSCASFACLDQITFLCHTFDWTQKDGN